jgi:hypothetical protein
MTFRNGAVTSDGYYRLVNAIRHETAAGTLDDAGAEEAHGLALGRLPHRGLEPVHNSVGIYRPNPRLAPLDIRLWCPCGGFTNPASYCCECGCRIIPTRDDRDLVTDLIGAKATLDYFADHPYCDARGEADACRDLLDSEV